MVADVLFYFCSARLSPCFYMDPPSSRVTRDGLKLDPNEYLSTHCKDTPKLQHLIRHKGVGTSYYWEVPRSNRHHIE